MKPQSLTVKFVDFWKGFDCHDNIFVEALERDFLVKVLEEHSSETPQLLIYSAFGNSHTCYDCIKLYFTGENDVPDFNQCDYAISAHYLELGNRHIRMPQYLLYKEYRALDVEDATVVEDVFDRPFCSVVVSNSVYAAPQRTEIIDVVEQYKPLAYGGAYRNNVGGRVPDKMAFIRQYKFNIALENSMVDGYTTEKLIEPMAACTVPIYWGNRMVGKEFNPESFINAADYNNYESLLENIKRIDSDRGAYMKMLCAPKILSDARVDWYALLEDFLVNIVRHGRKHIFPYGIMGHKQYMQRRKDLLYDNVLLRKCAGAWIKLTGGDK